MEGAASSTDPGAGPAPQRPELSRPVFFAALALLSVAVAYVVTAVPYLPTNDGPQHVLSGVLQKAFSEPGTPYSAILEPLPEFAEHGFSAVFVPLLEVLPWRQALQASLVLVALSGAWSFAALACAIAGRRTPWALLGFAIAFPWTLYMGFFPFVLGANVGLAIVALAARREAPRGVHLAAISALLLVAAVMHVASAAATGAIVFLVLALRAPAGARVRAMVTTAFLGAPAAAVLVLAILTAPPAPRTGTIPWRFVPAAEWVHELPRFLAPGPTWRALAACAAVVFALAFGARRARRGESSRVELAILVAAACSVALAAFGPLDVPGWQLVAPRFATFGVPLALALLASLSPSRDPRAALAVVLAVSALSLGATLDLHRRLSSGCAPALGGMSAGVDLAGFTLPFTLDPYCGVEADPKASAVPMLAPLFHVGALYAVARGGFTPYMFGGASAVHAFRYREDALERGAPPRPAPELYLALMGAEARADRAKRDHLVARFAEYGALYDHVLVVGAREDDLARILARGFTEDWRGATAMLAHPRRCTVDVLVDATQPREVVVELGQRPADRAVIALAAEGGDPVGDGVVRVRTTIAGCGPLWVRGFADLDRSGDASTGDVFCVGAGPDGRIAIEASEQSELRCRIDAPARR